MDDKNYYCVAKVRQTRIYLSYGYAHKQTLPGALHQGFQDLDQSIEFMRNHASSPEK